MAIDSSARAALACPAVLDRPHPLLVQPARPAHRGQVSRLLGLGLALASHPARAHVADRSVSVSSSVTASAGSLDDIDAQRGSQTAVAPTPSRPLRGAAAQARPEEDGGRGAPGLLDFFEREDVRHFVAEEELLLEAYARHTGFGGPEFARAEADQG